MDFRRGVMAIMATPIQTYNCNSCVLIIFFFFFFQMHATPFWFSFFGGVILFL